MKSRVSKLCLALFSMVLFAVTAFAQTKSVAGIVNDNNGDPIIGANVVIKGQQEGTMTDVNGEFSLKNVPQNGTLRVTFIGYQTQDVNVMGKSRITVVLQEETEDLDEVVVVGYGVQKKSDVTGAMISVDAKALKQRPTNNALEALQGKAAGVDIRTSDRPGEMGDVYIRGLRSVNASNSPLYVVDGVPLNGTSFQTYEEGLEGASPRGGQLESINPSDIESVEVLKDASATAIYGSRGANGVVLITTKRGKDGKFTFSYAGSVSTETVHDRTSWMNAGDYITWRRWAYYYADPVNNPRGDQPNYDKDYNTYFYGASDPYAWANIEKGWSADHKTWDGSKVTTTDWAGMVTQTGVTTEHTISGQGGNEKSQEYVSFGWMSNKGTIKGQEYERYTMKVSNDLTLAPWLKMGGSINATYSVQDYGMSNDGGTTSGPRSAYAAAKQNLPYAVPYDNDGNVILYPGADSKIKTIVNEWNYSTDERKVFRALGSFYAQVDFGKIWEPLKGLQYKINFGPDFRYMRRGFFNSAESVNREGTNTTSLAKSTDISYTLDNMLLYNRSFGKHDLGVTLLQSATDYQYETNNMRAIAIDLESALWNAMGTKSELDSWSSGISRHQLLSYMGRINYTYNKKYMLTTSLRFDGASQLAEGNKWSSFASFALGWRMDQEAFLADVEWIEQLKLRAGYGETGNAAISPYQTKGAIAALYYPFGGGLQSGYTNYNSALKNGNIAMANEDLGWERTAQFNYGVDFSFIGGRINGVFDIYHSRTTDLLFQQNIPTITGYKTTWNNIGETKNFGYDLTLNVVPVRTQDWEWSIGLSAGYSKNEIVSLSNGKEDDVANGLFIGESLQSIYTYACGPNGGIWRPGDEAEMQKFNDNGSNFQIGMGRPADLNGDYKIDANNDRKIIGHYDPRWTVGINSTLSWKSVELGIQMYGRMDYTYASQQSPWVGGRYNIKQYDYYTENNTDAKYPKPIYNDGGADTYYYVMGYQNGSYLKIRNISLGWTVPAKWVKKAGLSNLKAYMQLKNPGMIFSKCDDVDMDTYSNLYNKGVTFGLNVSF